jgi:hypothetical protein
MKVHIILEDTPEGITLDGTVNRSGYSDVAKESLAALVASSLAKTLWDQQKAGLLRVRGVTISGSLAAP